MYVCICNGISDARLIEAAREGGTTVDEVYANLGAQPQCRKCVPHVERILGLESAAGPTTQGGSGAAGWDDEVLPVLACAGERS